VKARTVLSSILQTAIEGELLAANPVRTVRAPRRSLQDEVRPLAPAAVEALRAQLSHRDAVLVSPLMAYAGLRPQEARTLRWGPVIPRPSDGGELSAKSFNVWRGETFVPALERAGLDRARPYDLRHSFASLLLHEGRSVIYVARQLGHDARYTLGTYGHVIDELDDQPRISTEDAIYAARGASAARSLV
jgi:integrase